MNQPQSLDELPEGSFAALIGALLAALAGAVLALLVAPMYVPALAQSLQGESPKAYWYFSRSTAFVAFGLLWLSVVFGLLMTGKLSTSWPGHVVAFELHQYTSVLGLAFALFHALVLLGDRYINYTLEQLLVPMGSVNYRVVEVALGQVAFYLFALVTFSFYIRRVITQRVWRLIHYLSFAVFVMVLAHGITAGSDSGDAAIQALYWFAGGSVLFLTIYRVLSRFVQQPGRAVGFAVRASATGRARASEASGPSVPSTVGAGSRPDRWSSPSGETTGSAV